MKNLLLENGTLNSVPEISQNESVLFVERVRKIVQHNGVRQAVFLNCNIIQTDERIIICQKMLFKKSFIKRYDIRFCKKEEIKTKTIFSFKGMYLRILITTDYIEVDRQLNKIKIKIPVTKLTPNHSIVFETDFIEKYVNYLSLKNR